MSSNHLILCHPLLLLPSIFPQIRVFSNELALCIRWPEYWSFSFSISHSNEYSGLISYRTDWLDLLAVQGTLKSLIQHHSSKAQFFGTQPSLPFNSHMYCNFLSKVTPQLGLLWWFSDKESTLQFREYRIYPWKGNYNACVMWVQLSPHATTAEPLRSGALSLQLEHL